MRDSRIFYSYWSKNKHNCINIADFEENAGSEKKAVYEKKAGSGKNAGSGENAPAEPDDPFTGMTVRLLEAAGLSECLAAKAGVLGKNVKELRIAIKPNLVCPVPAEFGATTHPQIVAGIIEYLRSLGCEDITVMEGSWVGDDTADSFLYCGYTELAEKYGVRLLDTKKELAVAVAVPEAVRSAMMQHLNGAGNGKITQPASVDIRGKDKAVTAREETEIPRELKVCRCALETDFLINVPVLKGHCQTRMTCALKNMKGLIPDAEKRHFHAMGLHMPIALLNTLIHQDFIVVDHICGDPEFEDGGNPLVRNCVMAAYDPVTADMAACEILGVDPESVEYLRLSGMLAGEYAQLNKMIVEGEPYEAVADTHRLLDVNYMVDEVESCSACYSVLIGALDRLKAEGLLEKFINRLSVEAKSCDAAANMGAADGALRIGIGQGCRGKSGKIGVGQCTSGYEWTVRGCPPEEDDIYEMLKTYTGV